MERESSVWSFFTKKANYIATCNTCDHDYSFRASVSNLRKHWYNKHGKQRRKTSERSDLNSDMSDLEQDKSVSNIDKKEPSETWNYFEVLDSDKFEATCKICDRNITFESVSDLTKHVQEHGEKTKDSDDDYSTGVPEKKLNRRFKSRLWNYFKATDDKMAVCLLCKKLFNYGSTITNLRRHLVRKHGHSRLLTQDDEDDGKTLILNGQLYQIESEGNQEENDDDEPKEMDTIYLEESMDLPPTPSPKKRQPVLPTKRNFTKITKEQVTRSRDNSSEDLELPAKRILPYTSNTMGSLDYFGQYVVSLLKELPKTVSDQLQSEIIKQILTSKMALESQTGTAKYEITISQNNQVVSNVPEPVSYTVVQSSDTAEKFNEITKNIVQE